MVGYDFGTAIDDSLELGTSLLHSQGFEYYFKPDAIDVAAGYSDGYIANFA